ncbi:MAG: CvpA family protein [Candidatus Cloacimonetes bacterium]|nr:CvpA family protein [Candidatus Cloacimonadota bacterium]
MGTIDWIILGFLLVFIFLGWRRGLIASLVQLAGFVLTFFLVGHYYPLVQRSLLLRYHLSRALSTVISVLLIIVLIVVVMRLVIYVLNRLLKALKLSSLNKGLGATMGLANGLLMVIILMVMLDFMPKISAPLKNGEKHRVYAGVNVLKEEMFAKLKLSQRMKLIKMPRLPFRKETPPEMNNIND